MRHTQTKTKSICAFLEILNAFKVRMGEFHCTGLTETLLNEADQYPTLHYQDTHDVEITGIGFAIGGVTHSQLEIRVQDKSIICIIICHPLSMDWMLPCQIKKNTIINLSF